MPDIRVLMTGLGLVESPRWHEGQLWFADWLAGDVITIDSEGNNQVALHESAIPLCFDWLPDGQLLIVSGTRLLRQDSNGSVVVHADLAHLGDFGWNDIAVDSRGNAYVNNVGFDFAGGGDVAPGTIASIAVDGSARQAADGVMFPNGMVVTPDDSTLIVAESYASRLTAFDIGDGGTLSNRRVWAELDGGVPDGICLDAEGAVWYSDVPNARCTRVAEGGDVLQTVQLDRGCFACALGGDDGMTLFMMAAEWGGPAEMVRPGTGRALAVTAPAPRAAGRSAAQT